ncbi:MAG TPA: MFS transporter [Actinomycetota bacterium]|nr:MFS transporter [Actinomycetota bacterium]
MSLLRRRDFLLIFAAFALSALGDYVALITLTLRIQETTGSGWAVAGLLLTGLVPPVLLAPLAGLLVDRLETVRVLAVTALLQAAVATALAFTTGVFPTLGLSFLLGAGLAVTQPALFALLPRAVGEERTTQANAYLEVARWGGAAAGPVLAAVLSHRFGAGSTLLANAVTFVAVAVLVSLLRVRRYPEPHPEEAATRRGQARAGMVYIAREPLLRVVVPMVGFMVVFAAADNVAEVFFAKDVLQAGDTGYGVLVTTWTIGMVIGSTAAGRFLRPAHLAPAVVLLPIVGGGAVALAAAAAIYPLAVAMFLVGGFANGVELVGMRSLLHRRVPDRLRGRAFAAYYGMVQAAQIVAMGASGGLVELAGPRMTMVFAGLGTAAVGVVGTLLYLRIPSAGRRTLEPAPTPPWVPA